MSTDDSLAAIEAFEFEHRMSDADALMWNIEKDPLLRSTITTVFVLDRTPDHDRLLRTIDRASRVVPRLRQRVLGHPFSIAPPRWEIDPNFDLSYHVRWMRAVGEGGMRELFDIAEPIAMQGFDRARPLWEFTVVEGLADGRAALVAKIHHAITDGVGGMKLQMELIDLERDPATPRQMPPAPEPTRLTERQRWIDAITYESRRQLSAAGRTVAGAAGSLADLARDPVRIGVDGIRTVTSVGRTLRPATEPLSPLMRNRSLSVRFDTMQLPLGTLKGASKVVSGRLNDAFLAGVSGGLRRYHLHHGHDVDRLRTTMPINVRTSETDSLAGNQFAPARFPVPIGIDDPIARMTAVRELVARQRAEPALALTEPLANLLNRLPATATTAVFGAMLKGIDFVTSNVPGPPVTIYMGGALVESQIALGPLTGAAVNVVLLSYAGDVTLGINTDPAAIPDPDVFTDCLRDSFDEIAKLA